MNTFNDPINLTELVPLIRKQVEKWNDPGDPTSRISIYCDVMAALLDSHDALLAALREAFSMLEDIRDADLLERELISQAKYAESPYHKQAVAILKAEGVDNE